MLVKLHRKEASQDVMQESGKVDGAKRGVSQRWGYQESLSLMLPMSLISASSSSSPLSSVFESSASLVANLCTYSNSV